MKTVNISNEQVQQAARSGVKLLTDDERVSVPPSMSMSGDFHVMMTVLQGLASGSIVVAPPTAAETLQTEPNTDLEPAVG